jgi:hypothetical protein
MDILRRSGGLFAALVVCAASAHAQAANADPHDFQGMWQGPPANHSFAAGFSGPPPKASGGAAVSASTYSFVGTNLPLKPATLAKAAHDQELILKGTAVMTWHVACRPSMPQALMSDDLGGFQVVQTPTRILFLFDTDNTYWEVYLDRGQPPKVAPSYFGHAVGHWEGKQLVVDSIGYNGRASLIVGALPSRSMHTITRIWKSEDGKKLEYQTWLDDPVNLIHSATLPTAFVSWSPDFRLYEEHCTQNPREQNDADMIYEDFTREDAFPYFYKK